MPKESQDPIERKRRELLDKQKELSSQLSSLNESINKPAEADRDPQAPPVWKDDPDEEFSLPGPSRAEKQQAARKRTQDMLIFFFYFLILAGAAYGLYFLFRIYYLPHANVLSQFTYGIDE